MKPGSPEHNQTQAKNQDGLAPAKPAERSAATAMNVGGPVAFEADAPSEIILKEFCLNSHDAAPTPGNWRYEPEFGAVVVVVGHELKAVADFGKCDLPGTHANGRLMAASKELLEALQDTQQALAHIIHVTKDLPIEFSSSVAIKWSEDKARTVIAKVLGSESSPKAGETLVGAPTPTDKEELVGGEIVRVGLKGMVATEIVGEALPAVRSSLADRPRVDADGNLHYSAFVKRGSMLVNREALDWDDPQSLHSHLSNAGIKPEDYGIKHPLAEAFKGRSRDDLIHEVLNLRAEVEAFHRAGF